MLTLSKIYAVKTERPHSESGVGSEGLRTPSESQVSEDQPNGLETQIDLDIPV